MESKNAWKRWAIFGALFIVATLAVASVTGYWVLTALPIGFLFGFFLQKGDLCGASAFSEVILTKSWSKILGIWTVIVVSMLGFALLHGLDLITLTIKPMWWLNYLIGGAIFGIGMVLAGGCVSGCLYKSGTGNLNSIVALIGIPLGISLVEYGPLKSAYNGIKSATTIELGGDPPSLFALLGVPYWTLALFFGAATLLATICWRRKHRSAPADDVGQKRFSDWLTRSWKPWQAGLAIGLLAMVAYLSSAASGRNYPLGVTHGVLFTQVLITDSNIRHIYEKSEAEPALATPEVEKLTPNPEKKVVWWLVLLIATLVLGSHTSARMSGEVKLLPKPPDQVLIALVGGFLVGTGAAFAKGCVVGNIMSGWALMSLGTVLFGVVAILFNWAATYLYLMGGGLLSDS
jgi:uncharacterized membrane protein YedE/YeeE